MSSGPLVCIVEIPKGSRNKYEYDARYGGIKLDRFLSASVVYPTDYGYFPDTLAPDGDELDGLVCVSEPTFPGCIIPVKPIGLFEMSDEEGSDDTVVCVPFDDPGWNELQQVEDLPDQLRREISHFFSVYKDLDPGRESEVTGWGTRDEALQASAGAIPLGPGRSPATIISRGASRAAAAMIAAPPNSTSVTPVASAKAPEASMHVSPWAARRGFRPRANLRLYAACFTSSCGSFRTSLASST